MPDEDASMQQQKRILLPILLSAAAGVVITIWLVLTPPGLAGKLRAIADSVCHGNPEHTLLIAYRLLPMCARCTGMFLGCLLGLIGFSSRTDGKGYPARIFKVILGLFVLFFAVDGVNSVAFSLFARELLYPPSNLLRLASGLGMGVVMAAVLIPLWRQIMRPDSSAGPVLGKWSQFLPVLFAEVAAAFLVLYAPAWMYYPIAVASVAAVPILVTMVYTLLWILILKIEAAIRNCSARITYIALGCITAFVQIGLLDLLRVTLTGNWAGIRF
jgi:uncharacterized membrane protein